MFKAAVEKGLMTVTGNEKDVNRETEEKRRLTLAIVRDRGINGADISDDEYESLKDESESMLASSRRVRRDIEWLRDRHIQKHNATGVTPYAPKFRVLRRYRGRDDIIRRERGKVRKKLLAYWDERDASRYDDEYTRIVNDLLDHVPMYWTDLDTYKWIHKEFWAAKSMAAKTEPTELPFI